MNVLRREEHATAVPVLLDENDNLVATVPPSPNDGAFRRALFVMLVVLGMFAAFGYIDSRESRQLAEMAVANQEAERIRDRERAAEQRKQADRIALDAERARDRARALERLIVLLLAESDNPEVRAAFEEFRRERGLEPGSSAAPSASGGSGTTRSRPEAGSGAPSGGSEPSPSPSSSPQPQPQPSPEPEPTPRPLPILPTPICTSVICVG